MTKDAQRIAIDPVWERFWSKVAVAESSRCWAWGGRKDDRGYGQFNFNGMITRAPRVAFLSRYGRWPDNACHKCDNPTCCNPDHIFDGSRCDNMRDMVAKGRNKTDRGEKHGGAVLSESKVLAMRAEYKTGTISLTTLAVKYGCSFSTAQRIIARKNWTHI